LLPERPASALQHRWISRCTIRWCSTVLRHKSNCPRGICSRCIIERFPQTSKAFRFAGDIAISGNFAGVNSFDCHFCFVFF